MRVRAITRLCELGNDFRVHAGPFFPRGFAESAQGSDGSMSALECRGYVCGPRDENDENERIDD